MKHLYLGLLLSSSCMFLAAQEEQPHLSLSETKDLIDIIEAAQQSSSENPFSGTITISIDYKEIPQGIFLKNPHALESLEVVFNIIKMIDAKKSKQDLAASISALTPKEAELLKACIVSPFIIQNALNNIFQEELTQDSDTDLN